MQARSHMSLGEEAGVGYEEAQTAAIDVDGVPNAAHGAVLRQLGEAVSRIAASCEGISRSRMNARPSRKLVLPELSDQERTLRATVDKLVRPGSPNTCAAVLGAHPRLLHQ